MKHLKIYKRLNQNKNDILTKWRMSRRGLEVEIYTVPTDMSRHVGLKNGENFFFS